jgi:crotonobetainyl-CoA:carnitine CoA-transferase CaiB-like acyl-CoA transferase
MNILLALRQRDMTGEGAHLDIAMTDGAAAFAWFGRAQTAFGAVAPDGGTTLLTGGSPRYRLYATADGWFVAVGALEEKFWRVFCDAAALPEALRSPEADAAEAIAAVSAIIAARDAAHWRTLLEPLDCCCTVVRTLAEADADPELRARIAADTMSLDQSGVAAPSAVILISPQFRPPASAPRQLKPFTPEG